MYAVYIVKRTQIYLTEDQDSRLAVIADTRGTTKSAVIREALDEFLDDDARRDDEMERFRRILREVAGAAPSLPSGKDYVEALRRTDAERQAALDRRWRGRRDGGV
jgi:hypothetical protein